MSVRMPALILTLSLTFLAGFTWGETSPGISRPPLDRIGWGLELLPESDIPRFPLPRWYSPGVGSVPELGSFLANQDLLLLRTGLNRTQSRSISDMVMELDHQSVVVGVGQSLALSNVLTLEGKAQTRYSWMDSGFGRRSNRLAFYAGARFIYRLNTYWGLIVSLSYRSG